MVVIILVITSLSALSFATEGAVKGLHGQDCIEISSANELTLIGMDGGYPLDGNYVQTCDIDLRGMDLNGGFSITLRVTSDDGALTIELLDGNGAHLQSESDILVVVNSEQKTIAPGEVSVEFDISSSDSSRFNVAAGGQADLLPFGEYPFFSVAGTYVVEDHQTVTETFDSNGNINSIGSPSAPFNGTYDGRGFKIIGIKTAMFSVMNSAYAGMFGQIGAFATLSNIDIEGHASSFSQYGGANSGILVGQSQSRNIMINNSFVNGYSSAVAIPPSPYADSCSGGLIGYSGGIANIWNCFSDVSVSSMGGFTAYSGGFVGYNSEEIYVRNSGSNADVFASADLTICGGLVGHSLGATVTDSYATGDVLSLSSSEGTSGGLIGYVFRPTAIAGSYNLSDVHVLELPFEGSSSNAYAGGLIGASGYITITDCYSFGDVTSDVTSDACSGGLVGQLNEDSNTMNSYVAGRIVASGRTSCVGAVGNFGDHRNFITNFYFLKTSTVNPDLELYGSGKATIDGIESGRRAEEPSGGYGDKDMRAQETYYADITTVAGRPVKGWDFSMVWHLDAALSPNSGYPVLRSAAKVMDLMDMYVSIGDDVTFTANTNDAVTHYQWQRYDIDSEAWMDLAEGIEKSFMIGDVASKDIGSIYRCKVGIEIDRSVKWMSISGPGQVLLAGGSQVLGISNMNELSKVGSNEIVNGVLFRPNGNYVQTQDIVFNDTDDVNGGFDVVVRTTLSDRALTVSLHYGDDARTDIVSLSYMSIAVNGDTNPVKTGESSASFNIEDGTETFDIIVSGCADNIPRSMDADHPDFAVRLTMRANEDSIPFNSNGNLTPIGTMMLPFAGTYDGGGFAITGLKTRTFSTKESPSGLFGYTGTIALANIHMEGDSLATSIVYSYSGALPEFGSVTGMDVFAPVPDPNTTIAFSGGLAGYVHGNIIIGNCTFKGCVTSLSAGFSGGLVGLVEGDLTITNCRSLGDVDSFHTMAFSGGLAGVAGGKATILDSYAKGEVASSSLSASFVGGLVCVIGGPSIIERCYAEGNMTSSGLMTISGGLFATMMGESCIKDCYALGTISSTASSETDVAAFSGGIAGYLGDIADISNCYVVSEMTAVGNMKEVGGIGNFIGGSGYLTNCYFIKDGAVNSELDLYGMGNPIVDLGMVGGTDVSNGYALSELLKKSTYHSGTRSAEDRTVEGWDFTDIWCIDQDSDPVADKRSNKGLPFLLSLAISEHPSNVATSDPTGETFSVSLNIVPAEYQWQRCNDGASWEDMDGEVGNSYTTKGDDGFNDLFRCRVSYGNESILTRSARLIEQFGVSASYDSDRGYVELSSNVATEYDTILVSVMPNIGHSVSLSSDVGTLTKTGTNRYALTGIEGDCVLMVEFDAIAYSVTTDHDESRGKVEVSAIETTVYDSVKVTVMPIDGYYLDRITATSGMLRPSGNDSFDLVRVTNDCVVTAVFGMAVNQVTTVFHDGWGDVSLSSDTATVKDTVIIAAEPGNGYFVDDVTVSIGDLTSIGGNRYELRNVTRDCTVTVTFEMMEYKVTASYNSDQGKVKLSADVVTQIDVVTIHIAPNKGHSIGEVTSTAGTLSKVTDEEYSLTDVRGDCIVEVGFNADPDPGFLAENALVIAIIAVLAVLGVAIGAVMIARTKV